MKVKVCGIKFQENLDELSVLPIDMIGLNFYEKSKRFITPDSKLSVKALPKSIAKVGVFVNALPDALASSADKYQLDYLQLHGDEDEDYILAAQKIAKVIKVFRVDRFFDFEKTESYSMVDLFLFDTYTVSFGGSGHKFDWDMLDNYKGSTPFLLAGGIRPSNIDLLSKLSHPALHGVDINSGFEMAAGLKNVDTISQFLTELKTNKE